MHVMQSAIRGQHYQEKVLISKTDFSDHSGGLHPLTDFIDLKPEHTKKDIV